MSSYCASAIIYLDTWDLRNILFDPWNWTHIKPARHCQSPIDITQSIHVQRTVSAIILQWQQSKWQTICNKQLYLPFRFWWGRRRWRGRWPRSWNRITLIDIINLWNGNWPIDSIAFRWNHFRFHSFQFQYRIILRWCVLSAEKDGNAREKKKLEILIKRSYSHGNLVSIDS